jgi:hypothetical protein
MEKESTTFSIIKEILFGLENVSPQKFEASRLLAPVFYAEAQRRGADMYLLSIIGSWGDTLQDSELLEMAKKFNTFKSDK